MSYNTNDSALPTRALADKTVIRASVVSATVLAHEPQAIVLRTTALAKAKTTLSSADSAMMDQQGLKVGQPVTGTLRIDLVSDGCIRVRYALGDAVPDNPTPMVVGSLPPPTICNLIDGLRLDAGMRAAPWLGEAPGSGAAVALDGVGMRALVGLDPLRIELHRPGGAVICGIGGREKDHFSNWDAYSLGVSQRYDGRPVAHECFDLPPGEAVYGLGERFAPSLDLVGQTVELWQRDALGTTTPRAYKNVPFLVTTGGWGVFFNHSSAGTAWVGSLSSCDIQLAFDEDFLDYYIFTGSISEILGQYTALTGRGDVPPDWTFGYWQSKISYKAADETLDIAERLRAQRLPCDVIHLDTFWFERDWYCNLEFAKDRFPDPAAYLAEMKRRGFKICLWQLPYVPEGNAYYDELKSVDGFVKRPDGSIYNVGICFTPGFKGTVGIIDFTNPAATRIYQERLRRLFQLGVMVIKTDFGEDAPADGVWHDGTPAHRMHNLYPLLYNLAASEVTKEVTGGGQVWHRSGWAGSQRHPVPWGGDNSPNWHNLAPQMRGGLSLGLSGFTFWSQDIGGFLGDTNDHLLLRWMQAGLFLSHSRVHGGGIRELDRFAPETIRIAREFLELRYRLLPYILAHSQLAAAAGLPLARPLVLDFQEDRNGWSVDDQWLFGRDLLVAPIMDAGLRRSVYLPPGTWYDWWTGAGMAGGRWIEAEAALDRIPLWLREGAIVPLGDVHQWVGDAPDRTVELVLTPLDSDGDRQLDFVVNGHATSALLTRRRGRHYLTVDHIPGVNVSPRLVGGVLADVRLEMPNNAMTAE
jgi:alpha-D-xyloside xylohydrolase